MATIKKYKNGTTITRERGNFDDWQIRVNGRAPFDVNYFSSLLTLSKNYGVKQVYGDFLKLYNETGKYIEDTILDNLIPDISKKYNNSLDIEILFATIYCVMLAEENKANTKLGKRIKGLAAHQILIENMDVYEACKFSYGKTWKEIANLCQERGL